MYGIYNICQGGNLFICKARLRRILKLRFIQDGLKLFVLYQSTLYQLWPQYDHSFGRQQPTLMHAGNEVRKIMKEADKNE